MHSRDPPIQIVDIAAQNRGLTREMSRNNYFQSHLQKRIERFPRQTHELRKPTQAGFHAAISEARASASVSIYSRMFRKDRDLPQCVTALTPFSHHPNSGESARKSLP
jgi:hypothetical protein